jgi:hypothetical protein
MKAQPYRGGYCPHGIYRDTRCFNCDPEPSAVLRAETLPELLDRTAAAIDDPARYIEVNPHYRAGWVDALRALRNELALMRTQKESR